MRQRKGKWGLLEVIHQVCQLAISIQSRTEFLLNRTANQEIKYNPGVQILPHLSLVQTALLQQNHQFLCARRSVRGRIRGDHTHMHARSLGLFSAGTQKFPAMQASITLSSINMPQLCVLKDSQQFSLHAHSTWPPARVIIRTQVVFVM